EGQLAIGQTDSDRAKEVAEEIRAAQAELQSVEPQWLQARAQLARAEVRAPVAGTIMGLKYNTIGAVVGAGQPLMDLVPEHASMVVDVQVAPKDVSDVRPG